MRKLTRASAPKMFDARDYVATHPGCCKLHVAEAVGPNGSRRYGYETVDRAIRAGLVKVQSVDRRGRYSLVAGPSGGVE